MMGNQVEKTKLNVKSTVALSASDFAVDGRRHVDVNLRAFGYFSDTQPHVQRMRRKLKSYTRSLYYSCYSPNPKP